MRKNKKTSLRKKIVYLMIAVVIVQSIIFLASTSLVGTFDRINNTSLLNFVDSINESAKNIEHTLESLAMNVSIHAQSINEKINYLAKEKKIDVEDVYGSEELMTIIYDESYHHLKEIIKSNDVMGSFIIFDKSSVYKNDENYKAILYLRNVSTSGQNLIYLERGPEYIKDKYELKDFGKNEEHISIEEGNWDFYKAHFKNPIYNYTSIDRFGIWSDPLRVIDSNEDVITFTVPMVDNETNKVYAVMGIEILVDYLQKSISESLAMPFDDSTFLLGQKNNTSLDSDWYISDSGLLTTDKLENDNITSLKDIGSFGIQEIKLKDADIKDYYLYTQDITTKRYSRNPEVLWTLMGFVSKDDMMFNSRQAFSFILSAIIISGALSIIFSILISFAETKSIRQLAKLIKRLEPHKSISFMRTNIEEIDDLTEAIEILNRKTKNVSEKIAKILRLSKIPVGCFEISDKLDMVLVTGSLLQMLGVKEDVMEIEFIEKREFENLYKNLISGKVYDEEDVYLWEAQNLNEYNKWLRMEKIDYIDSKLGIIVDISQEITIKKKYEYELDHDVMTKLLNRKAFLRRGFEAIKNNPDKIGAMFFADLDNLKFVNDNYGHDTGDKYIITAANMFGKFRNIGGIVARISGDEFAAYIHGFETIKEARDTIYSFVNENFKDSIITPTNKVYPIKTSSGIAWYPKDSEAIKILIKYADFAMYDAKNNAKGSIVEFNKQLYLENSFVEEKRNLFNMMMDENLIEYEFQPIIGIYEKKVVAYEALMRPKVKKISSTLEIISLATAYSRLYDLERLTIFNIAQWIYENKEILGDKKIFINTIPGTVLIDKDFDILEQKYECVFDSIIIEITENEHVDEETINDKIYILRKKINNSKIAISNFGSGYDNELKMIKIYPDIVNITQGLIRGISKDLDKKIIVSELITYCKNRNIKVLAEGIETEEELKTCIELGVDLAQGYFFARASEELVELTEEQVEVIGNILDNLEYFNNINQLF